MSKVTPTAVILGIVAIGGLVMFAYWRKKKNKEKPAVQQVPVVEEAATTTQEKLAMAAGTGLPGQRLMRTPVGFVMN